MNPGDVKAIINVIKNDPEVIRRVESILSTLLPDKLGLAGTFRNIGYVLRDLDPSNPDVAAKVCTGIAQETSKVIEREIKNGNPLFKNLKSATFDTRNMDTIIGDVTHDATFITTKGGETFVLDYHHTLNPENPMFYSKVSDWKNERNGITAETYLDNNISNSFNFDELINQINTHIQQTQSNINGPT